MLNASNLPAPEFRWYELPPGFIPPPPFHPTLKVVTEQQILHRVGRLLAAGQKEAALSLAHALARVLSYPHVLPAPQLVEMAARTAAGEAFTKLAAQICQCASCRAKRGEASA